MSKIQILSESAINQIAAGEVVENPASVVKELVENAVDAGSTWIHVEIFGGGFQSIRVSDNGVGMEREDALLAFERHATSKIVEASDLLRLQTMGFRGEALSSIAAISKMSVVTATEGAIGTQIDLEGGKCRQISSAARLRGSTFEVRFLFYNVPARKSFQKSPAASSAEITKVMTQLSLAHPDCGFELTQQGRQIFRVQAQDNRIGELLGDDYGIVVDHCPSLLKGRLGSPLVHHPNRSHQYLFINNRPVLSPSLSFTIKQAYGTRLPVDRHPMYVLHLTLDPEMVDVNVHPQKREVRFREEGALKDAIFREICRALEGIENPKEEFLPWNQEESFTPWRLQEERVFERPPLPQQTQFSFDELEEPPPLDEEPRSVGFFSHYWIVEKEGGLVWIDLLAIQERLSYEEKRPSQQLLIPQMISLTPLQMALVEAHEALLHRLGIEWRLLGKDTICVESLPPLVSLDGAEQYVREVVDVLGQGSEFVSSTRALTDLMRRQKKSFSVEEARILLKNFLKTKPPRIEEVMTPMSLHDIQSLFRQA